jgi:hypothetical protein
MRFRVAFGRAWRAAILALTASAAAVAWAETPAVDQGPDGRLIYAEDDRGNRIPDFSTCGYAGADRDIPMVPAVVTVSPADGDDGARIQAAIDHVAELPVGDDGFRGAVQLAPGEFQVAGQLAINQSGVVLRGSGAVAGGTTIAATGPDRRALIRVIGPKREADLGNELRVVDDYVPVGSRQLRLEGTPNLAVGDRVVVRRPSTKEWIHEIGADAFGVGWRPGSRDIAWIRTVSAVDGNTITLDAPITTALEKRFGGGTVARANFPGRLGNIGIEDMTLVSQPATDNPLDEDHAWHGITMEDVEDAWVRRIEFRGFAGGAVALWETTRRVTVEDCISLAPVSQIGGYRRHTFFTQGQQTLFLRCWSEQGRHDFAVGHCAAGPNAFVNCRTAKSLDDSGPLESWASGVLYDNVRIDGAGLDLVNRWIDPPGVGWSAANCVLWQCRAATIAYFRPPTANNWALGCWAGFSGDGTFESGSDFVRPMSLYQGQLRERLGDVTAKRVDPILGKPVTATNPTLEEAEKFVAQSLEPATELVDVIRERMERLKPEPSTASEFKYDGATAKSLRSPPAKRLEIKNGWLVTDDALVTGSRWRQNIWRGNMRVGDVAQFGPALTRFAPGRVGYGLTDDLSELAKQMQRQNVAAFDYSYSLWYDRRRDDHTMGRQKDGNVGPPFLEQPFARTGPEHGTAWDGLSKYDLTKFNRWYWDRLRDFAGECERHGLVLLHNNYLQHNILEAGAHWVDSPWRPANNVNDPGLPEPPPFIGDKRIFMAPTFYDTSNPKLRDLHRGYIRQCLDALAESPNVIQMTSAEYSGPLAFTEFWLDTIIEWEQEHGRDVLVALSAPKDVQDAILADPNRAVHVDVIDIRYWAYTADGGLYAPRGGQNLAPRQHLRQTRQKPGGAAAIVKAVREYRDRFPGKAVLYSAEENCPSTHDGWATLIAGASLADVRLPAELARLIPTMRPRDDIAIRSDTWCLGNDDGEYLLYLTTDSPDSLALRLPIAAESYRARWISKSSWVVTLDESVTVKSFPAKTPILWLSPLRGTQ